MSVLLIEIAEAALAAAKASGNKTAAQAFNLEQAVAEIVQKSMDGFRQETGRPLDPSLIRIEQPL